MKHQLLIKIFFSIAFLNGTALFAQDSTVQCKVALKDLEGKYTGGCKNGLAHGKGEAKGNHFYTGAFKKGLPNGKGTYYYSDQEYFTGNFQDGIKEGKGEMHYIENGKPDSLVKGYWSADEYRGKSYKTYNMVNVPFFDSIELEPSDGPGNSINIQTTATLNLFYVREVIATDGSFIKKLKNFSTKFSSNSSYELSRFPIKLMIIFSNGQQMQVELYKNADWDLKLFLNK